MMTDDIKREIIQYLLTYHSGKWVNPAIAIGKFHGRGAAAIQALNELIENNIIERKYVYCESREYPLVRYVDNTWDRPHLKLMDGGKA